MNIYRVVRAVALLLALTGARSPSVLADVPTAGATPAAAVTSLTREQAIARCSAMRGIDVSDVRDAPSKVTGAAVTRLAPDVPEACQIDGYVTPNVGFRISMPLEGWNGKFVHGGCGGACGLNRQIWCDQPLRDGYACLGSDMGHVGTTADWLWGYNEPGRRTDFGYRGTHVALLVGRALTERFYGTAPKRTYFTGCSTGGRQGMLAAQQFPWDYDGIAAGAPPLDETGTALQLAWSVRANQDANGRWILDARAVRRLHAAVLEACDLNDGLKDGVIGDPRACRIDPAKVQCAVGQQPTGKDVADCLTPAQVDAARKLYSGPVDSKGRAIGHQGGVQPGSELWWIGDYVERPDGTQPQYGAFLTDFFRYMAFDPSPGPAFRLADLDFERDAKRLGVMEMTYRATNPDLRRFRDAGGKLIMFQGWGDTSVVPGGTVDYYELVSKLHGGPQETGRFLRFFTAPGMRHCSADGSGGDMVNWLDALDRWVDRGEAPDVLLGYNFDWTGLPLRSPIFPPDPARVRFVRPLYRYPAVPVYSGKGDPKSPASWRPSTTVLR
jgi:hypothetical protein